MNKRTVLMAALVLLGTSPAVWSYGWDKDMANQPSVKPQEAEAPAGPGSVPVQGGEILPAPKTTEEADEGKERAVSVLNPVQATAESIARGENFYHVHCATCHGPQGRGDGKVGAKFVDKAPADLTDAYVQDQADGQLFYTLTRGRNLMPHYRDALSQEERWDVVNYVKHVLGKQ